MTKLEFLATVAHLDKRQGNYEGTLTPKWRQRREQGLWSVDDRFIFLFEYLTNIGYKVYVYEILTRLKKGSGKNMERMAHMWIPELNLAIRFSDKPRGEYDSKQKYFLMQAKHFFYCGVVHPETEDVLEYVEDLIERVKLYSKDNSKRGVKNNIVIHKRKRTHIVKSQKV